MLAYAAVRAHALAGLLVALGALGGVLLLAVLLRGLEELLAWALAVLALVYVVSVVVDTSRVDDAAPLVATALLLCGELAAWSLDARWRIAAEGSLVRRRVVALTGLALGGLTASALVIASAATRPGRGLAWTTLGAAAAVGVIGIAVAALRRST